MALSFTFIDKGLGKALADLPENTQGAIRKTVKDITKRALAIVKFKTPTDSTTAINGWRTRFENDGQRGIFFNEVPYINVLEFGGYPVVSTKKRKKTSAAAKKRKAKKAKAAAKRIAKETPRQKGVRLRRAKVKKKERGEQAARTRLTRGLKRGNALLGGFPPWKRTQKSRGGHPSMLSNVSKKAPRGMVRATIFEIEPEFIKTLAENIDKALVS